MESKTGEKTTASRRIEAAARLNDLRKVLAQARDRHSLEYELDVARSLEAVETDAAPLERYEYRLKAIDVTLSRLERGRYGICEKCMQEIPIGRLKAMPFAAYCSECQELRKRAEAPGRRRHQRAVASCLDAARRTKSGAGQVTAPVEVRGCDDSTLSEDTLPD